MSAGSNGTIRNKSAESDSNQRSSNQNGKTNTKTNQQAQRVQEYPILAINTKPRARNKKH